MDDVVQKTHVLQALPESKRVIWRKTKQGRPTKPSEMGMGVLWLSQKKGLHITSPQVIAIFSAGQGCCEAQLLLQLRIQAGCRGKRETKQEPLLPGCHICFLSSDYTRGAQEAFYSHSDSSFPGATPRLDILVLRNNFISSRRRGQTAGHW